MLQFLRQLPKLLIPQKIQLSILQQNLLRYLHLRNISLHFHIAHQLAFVKSTQLFNIADPYLCIQLPFYL